MNAVQPRPEGHQQFVALAGMALLVIAVLAFHRMREKDGATRDHTPGYLTAIETGEDHIDADTLATMMMTSPGDVVTIDVRPADEFAAFHLPGAVNLTVPRAVGDEGRALIGSAKLAVLYSNGPAHPGQAWVELRRAGFTNVRVLDGGLDEFRARVLTPASLRGPATEAQSKAEASSFALRSAFFGLIKMPPVASQATDPATLQSPTVVSPHWLRSRLGKVAVIDVRASAADYAAWHLPSAVHLEEKLLRVRRGDRELFLREPAELADTFGKLGLEVDTPVVVYGDDRLQDATMVVVALLSAGHRAVAILEGGIMAWTAAGGPLTPVVTTPVTAHYQPRPNDGFAIPIDELAKAVADHKVTVLDVRPPEFFRGEKSTEARAGHIPGAVNRPYQADLLDSRHWRAKSDLLADYAALALPMDRPVVVSCRTGHTASESFFVLRYLLGRSDVRWFNGSWTEWAERKDLPAELGAEAVR